MNLLESFREFSGLKLATKFEVCGTCQGKGSHVNPAIDGNGLSAEDFEEAGEDFRDDYMAGVYDVQCYECKGLRVVEVVDRERCSPEKLAAWDKWQREDDEVRAIERAERRAGA